MRKTFLPCVAGSMLAMPLASAEEEFTLVSDLDNPRAGQTLTLTADLVGSGPGDRIVVLYGSEAGDLHPLLRGSFDERGQSEFRFTVPSGIEGVPLYLQALALISTGVSSTCPMFLTVGTDGFAPPRAVLDTNGDPFPIAPTTALFRGLGSTRGDGEIVRYEWSFGDRLSGMGNRAEGMLASHDYGEPGTYDVTLTVVDQHGNSDRATLAYIVQPFAGNCYFLSSSLGDDSNDGLSEDHPWRTLPYALSQLGGRAGEPDRLRLRRGDEWLLATTTRVEGPLFVDAYGEGDRPLISFADGPDGEGLKLGDTRKWGSAVSLSQLHVRYLGAAHERDTLVVSGANGNAIRHCKIEKGGLFLIGYGGNVRGTTVQDCEISDARRMCIYGQETDWVVIADTTLTGSGHATENPLFSHQTYLSSMANLLIENSVFDGADTGNNNFGAKLNAVFDVLFRNCEVLRTNNGLCVGTNITTPDDPPCRNVVVDGCRLHDNGFHDQGAGIWILRIEDVTIENSILHSTRISPRWGVAGIHFSDTDPGARVGLFHNTFYSNEVADLLLSGDSNYAHIEIKNNIFYRTGEHPPGESLMFFDVRNHENVLPKVDCDYNLFYWEGQYSKALTIAVDTERPTLSLRDWQLRFGQDLHSTFADPLFRDAAQRDFELEDRSPAIDRGLVLPTIISDQIRALRPKGLGVDLGALERPER